MDEDREDLLEDDEEEVAQDLLEEDLGWDVNLPDHEPSVPACYEDGWDPDVPPDYSDLPPPDKTRVVALDRWKYEEDQARQRFAELQAKHGWRVIGEPFWTARHYCWRVTW